MQAFRSDSSTVVASIRSSRDSTYTTESSGTFYKQDDFEDVSKDIELGTLPTTNPQAVENTTNPIASRVEKFKKQINLMRRTGFLDFMKVLGLSVLASQFIFIFIAIGPWLLGNKWIIAIAMKYIEVINGTVDYQNGTIAPVNNINLAGSNLTVDTCKYIDFANTCTDEAYHNLDVKVHVAIVFAVLLNVVLFYALAVDLGFGQTKRWGRRAYQ